MPLLETTCQQRPCSPFALDNITQRLIDPVHGGYVEAVHVEDARRLMVENERLRSTIYHLTDTLGFAVDMAKANHAALIAEVDRRMTPVKPNNPHQATAVLPETFPCRECGKPGLGIPNAICPICGGE